MQRILGIGLLTAVLAGGILAGLNTPRARAISLSVPDYCINNAGELEFVILATLATGEARVQFDIRPDEAGAAQTLIIVVDAAGTLVGAPFVANSGGGPDRLTVAGIALTPALVGEGVELHGVVQPGTQPLDPGDYMADTFAAAFAASGGFLSGFGFGNVFIGDCDPTALPGDDDGDGIADALDTQPGFFSNTFNDGSGTLGEIIQRHDFTVSITDATDAAAGVNVTVAGAADDGALAADLTLSCNPTRDLLVYPGSADITCGSLSVKVLSGKVEWTLPNGTLVRVEAGGDVTENDDGTVVANPGSTTGAATLVDSSGNETPLNPVSDPETDSDGDGLPDGIDPDALAELFGAFDEGAWASPGVPRAAQSILADVQLHLLHGNVDEALAGLNVLSKRSDGCDSAASPDNNDWLLSCEAQADAQAQIGALVAALSE